MSKAPLVSIICLCYNHEKFVEEALLSLIHQDYPSMEIIVIDDKSTDNSVQSIQKIIAGYPEIVFIKNEHNLGNCKSFNSGFERSKGEYIIDFATDDVMVPGKIKKQVDKFLSLSEKYGVVYSEAEVINERGEHLGYHHKGTNKEFYHPEGDIFKYVLKKYFICPPSMMMRRSVLEKSGGYDTELAYEDFNFWVLSSREFFYAYIDEALVKRRVVEKSLSMSFYTKNNPKIFQSTLCVIEKAHTLCKTSEEYQVLAERIRFELRHAAMMQEFSVAEGYRALLMKMNTYDVGSKIFYFISKKHLTFFWLYKFILRYKGIHRRR